MHGNVEELCRQAGGGYRARSGHSGQHPLFARSASRNHSTDVGEVSYQQRGFRVVIVGDHLPRSAVGAPISISHKSPLPATFSNSIGMEFVVVPKGRSWIGGGANRPGKIEIEMPADFYLGKYEVTQSQWKQVTGEDPSSCHLGTAEELPVETVSWHATSVFIDKLNQREKDTGWIYRLPTEVEWEYACRGGPMLDRSQSRFDFYFETPTNNVVPEQANFDEDTTMPVGTYSPNSLGLYDMHGNVHEWCFDQVEMTDGPTCRAHRGGCWKYGSGEGAAGLSGKFPGDGISRHLGLRLARVPAPKAPDTAPPAPFTDADVQRIVALPAPQRVAAVVAALKALNPGLDGTSRHTIAVNKVTEFSFQPYPGHDVLTDLSPLRALPDLRSLNLWGCSGLTDLQTLKGMPLIRLVIGSFDVKNSISDLEPLRDMKLIELRLSQCPIENLEPLRGMPLRTLRLVNCDHVRDLGPLKDMPLSELHIAGTSVSELSGLAGMPLKYLTIHRTPVTDLTPLQGFELERLYFTPKSITQGLDVIRNLSSLTLIGYEYDKHSSTKEFWERYDKGEFSK
jgi:formylglycine-generating enzyme required for sulfatase activity